MMQFNESLPLPLHPLNSLGPCLDAAAAAAAATKPSQPSSRARGSCWPGFPSPPSSSNRNLGALSSSSSSCMEQLLVHCAHAVDRNDATLAHQIFWVLNTIAPPDGDCTQRLASAFLRALIARASRTGSCQLSPSSSSSSNPTADRALLHRFSPLDLAAFIDLTPYHRFGFSAANAAIVDAVEGFSVVHIVDLGTTHCMQLPTLIDSLSSRPEGPPFVRLTVPCPPTNRSSAAATPPPLLDLSSSYEELGARLVNFALTRSVGTEFRAVPSSPADGFETLIEQVRLQRPAASAAGGEALVVNCQMVLHYIPDETANGTAALPPLSSRRSMFLENLRGLEPTVVTLVDEDVDLAAGDVAGRLRSAFNYLWIQYDAVDTFLPRGSERRRRYEAGLYWKIENVIAHEGAGRMERPEPRGRWAQRMRSSRFRGVGFSEEAATEVKGMLDEHAAGWGLKKEEEDDGLVLTWKGHNVVFATAWVPAL